MKTFFLSWGMLVLSVIFNAVGVFVVKLRLNELGVVKTDSLKAVFDYFFVLMKSPVVAGAVVLFFIAPVLFAIALSYLQITVAYPVQIGLNFIFVVLLAVIFLGEQISLFKIIGIVLILVGVYLLNKGL